MQVFRPSFEVVRKRVERSLNMLMRNDIYLFEVDVHERTIAHRFAVYLEKEFSSWNVDCEYDRNQYDSKLITAADNSKKQKAYPDIIIHHRGTSANLLAIELKKGNAQNDQAADERKLREYVNRLNYSYGLFVSLATGTSTRGIYTVRWIHGEESRLDL